MRAVLYFTWVKCPALQTIIPISNLLSTFRCAVAQDLPVAALNFICEHDHLKDASE